MHQCINLYTTKQNRIKAKQKHCYVKHNQAHRNIPSVYGRPPTPNLGTPHPGTSVHSTQDSSSSCGSSNVEVDTEVLSSPFQPETLVRLLSHPVAVPLCGDLALSAWLYR